MTVGNLVRVVLLALLPWTAHADLRLVTEDNPPLNFRDAGSGEVRGVSVDVLREAAARTHVKIGSIALLPMVRAIELARTEADTCVFPLVRTAERERQFVWVGPYTQNIWVFYARNDFATPIATLDDAKHFRIGSDLHSVKTAYLLSHGFTNLDLVPEDANNPKKLAAGRFDLWLVGLYEGRIFAQQAHINDVKPVFEVKRVDYYLACQRALAPERVAALNAALGRMQADGTIQRMTDQYTSQMAH